MLVYTCDHCGATFADGEGWVTVVHYFVNDDGEWDEDADHFCDDTCLAAWAFARAAEHTR